MEEEGGLAAERVVGEFSSSLALFDVPSHVLPRMSHLSNSFLERMLKKKDGKEEEEKEEKKEKGKEKMVTTTGEVSKDLFGVCFLIFLSFLFLFFFILFFPFLSLLSFLPSAPSFIDLFLFPDHWRRRATTRTKHLESIYPISSFWKRTKEGQKRRKWGWGWKK